jgi:hypothetical protein
VFAQLLTPVDCDVLSHCTSLDVDAHGDRLSFTIVLSFDDANPYFQVRSDTRRGGMPVIRADKRAVQTLTKRRESRGALLPLQTPFTQERVLSKSFTFDAEGVCDVFGRQPLFARKPTVEDNASRPVFLGAGCLSPTAVTPPQRTSKPSSSSLRKQHSFFVRRSRVQFIHASP